MAIQRKKGSDKFAMKLGLASPDLGSFLSLVQTIMETLRCGRPDGEDCGGVGTSGLPKGASEGASAGASTGVATRVSTGVGTGVATGVAIGVSASLLPLRAALWPAPAACKESLDAIGNDFSEPNVDDAGLWLHLIHQLPCSGGSLDPPPIHRLAKQAFTKDFGRLQ